MCVCVCVGTLCVFSLASSFLVPRLHLARLCRPNRSGGTSSAVLLGASSTIWRLAPFTCQSVHVGRGWWRRSYRVRYLRVGSLSLPFIQLWFSFPATIANDCHFLSSYRFFLFCWFLLNRYSHFDKKGKEMTFILLLMMIPSLYLVRAVNCASVSNSIQPVKECFAKHDIGHTFAITTDIHCHLTWARLCRLFFLRRFLIYLFITAATFKRYRKLNDVAQM